MLSINAASKHSGTDGCHTVSQIQHIKQRWHTRVVLTSDSNSATVLNPCMQPCLLEGAPPQCNQAVTLSSCQLAQLGPLSASMLGPCLPNLRSLQLCGIKVQCGDSGAASGFIQGLTNSCPHLARVVLRDSQLCDAADTASLYTLSRLTNLTHLELSVQNNGEVCVCGISNY